MHARCCRIDCERVTRTQILREIRLETRRLRPRRDPSRTERIGHLFDFLLPDRGHVEGNERLLIHRLSFKKEFVFSGAPHRTLRAAGCSKPSMPPPAHPSTECAARGTPD